jgi:hypothetical protein
VSGFTEPLLDERARLILACASPQRLLVEVFKVIGEFFNGPVIQVLWHCWAR